MVQTKSRSVLFNQRTIVATIAFAATWSWLVLGFQSIVMDPFHLNTPGPYHHFGLILSSLITALIPFGISVIAPAGFKKLVSYPASCVVIIILTPMNCMPAALSFMDIDYSYVTELAPSALSGIGFGMLLVQLTGSIVAFRRREVTTVISFGLVASMVIFLITISIMTIAALVLYAMLPIVGTICSLVGIRSERARTGDAPDGASADDDVNAEGDQTLASLIVASSTLTNDVNSKMRSSEIRSFILNMVSVFAFAIICGAAMAVSLLYSIENSSFFVFAVLCLVACVVACLYSTFSKAATKNFRLQQISAVVIGITIMPTSFLGFGAQAFYSSIMVAAFMVYLGTIIVTVSDNVSPQNIAGSRYVPIAMLCNLIGLIVGWGIGLLFLSTPNGDINIYAIVVVSAIIASIILLYFAIKFIMSWEEVHRLFNIANTSNRRDFNDRCRDIADHNGLSPREREVFTMLASGHNSTYIEETLVISGHTVKTHMNNIYHKLGIHTQQELIDIVK
ncbi:MAG: helix-turn-helix transcriptional regulator [Coriobacteriales bacterium]|jgi:DNA-binding CsgD family transcriptional regulator|nr:helix-turn-helix transcriptional regulator [Coriobacteriales bacterium]